MPIRPALVYFPGEYDYPGPQTLDKSKNALPETTFKPALLRVQENQLADSAKVASAIRTMFPKLTSSSGFDPVAALFR
jgi:hypothetical protein